MNAATLKVLRDHEDAMTAAKVVISLGLASEETRVKFEAMIKTHEARISK